MKAATQKLKKKFSPGEVTLTLETQQEVDALYALLNHCEISRAVGLSNGEHQELGKFRDLATGTELHCKLCEIIR